MNLGRFDLTIGQIIQQYPETRDVFIHNGFPIFADDVVLEQLGSILKLRTALKSKDMNGEVFVQLLEQKIEDTGRFQDIASEMINSPGQLNMLALLPCPLKVPLQSELSRFIDYLHREKGLNLNYIIESHYNDQLNYGDYVKYFEDPDEIPDIIFTAGYSFYYKNFVERFVKTGVFASVPNQAVNSSLAEAAIVDQGGHFTVVAVNVLVMVVDTRRLGKLPLPRRWADILTPEYAGKVVMRGHDDYFCDVVQMNFYKEYGEAGIKALARTVKYGIHPAQMVKELSSGRSDIPPIHIMPYFFANTIANRDNITIIWPEDGALAYPVSVLVKADKMKELNELAGFLTGPEVARICADAFFPAVHPEVRQHLPAGAKFKWLGWEFIKNNDIENLINEVNEQFLQAYREGEC